MNEYKHGSRELPLGNPTYGQASNVEWQIANRGLPFVVR